MKIKLNENECYELKLKDEYTKEEFFEILNRFNILAKMFCKDDILTISKNPNQLKNTVNREKYVSRWQYKDRNIVLEIIKAHYNKDKSSREEVKKKYQLTRPWSRISADIFQLKKRHNILPEEVGLKAFPGKGWYGENIERV